MIEITKNITHNHIINALTNGSDRKDVYFSRVSTNTNRLAWDTFRFTGVPAVDASAYGSLNAGEQITNSKVGLPHFSNLTGGKRRFLANIQGISSRSGGYYIFYDRLWQAQVSANVTSSTAITGTQQIPSRDALGTDDGHGCSMFISLVGTGFTPASARTMTITYTNSKGETGRVATASFPAGSVTTDSIFTPEIFVPLQSGDTGVRSVQSYQLDASWGSVNVAIVIARPLAVHMEAGTGSSTIPGLIEINGYSNYIDPLPELYDGTSIGLLTVRNGTSFINFEGTVSVVDI